MDNQQQNNNFVLKFEGKTIKKDDQMNIINQYVSGESLSQLSKLYNYNIATIRYFLIKNDIKIRNVKESVKKFHKQLSINMDDFLEENIIGWLLGDGGLRMSSKSINPHLTYSDTKISHINYIENILTKYNIQYSITQNKSSGVYQLQSEALPELHKYYDLFYGYEGLNENNQKRKILPNIDLTPIILRNWYIGDGCSSKGSGTYNHKGTISCKYKNDYILEQLNKICGLVACYEKKGKYPSFDYHFNNKALIKLLDYIGECPCEEYKYK